MIYLICAKDNRQNAVELLESENYKNNSFYKYFCKNFEHKNILYPIEFYKNVSNEVIPHRVNIVYEHKDVKNLPNVLGAIVTNNIKDIVKAYRAEIDDVYIFATNKWLIEEFEPFADYLIVFSADDIGTASQPLSDFIDFGNFNLLRSQMFEKYHFEFYVTNKKIGK